MSVSNATSILSTIWNGPWPRLSNPEFPSNEAVIQVDDRAITVIIESLQNLNHHSEADFLRVGSLLLQFLDSANQIAAGYRDLADCTTGKQGHTASDVLTAALEFCRRMEALTTARAVHLASLRTGTAAIRSALAGHLEATASFRALCLLIRVETARLDGKGLEFVHFSEDVNELMARMNANVDDVQHVNGRLNARIESAVATLSGGDKQLRKLSAVITGAMDGLSAFSARQAEAIALSTRLANESAQVATAIQGAVKSIQFHDITRQQVEHVIGVLTGSSQTPEKVPKLSLAAHQLGNVDKLFSSSLDTLWRELQRIAAAVTGMTESGRSLTPPTSLEQNSLFLTIEHSLHGVLQHRRQPGCRRRRRHHRRR